MRSSKSTLRTATIAAITAVVAGGGAAAIAGGGPDTAMTVGPRTLIASPADSPADFPGVRAARRGSPLPAGYVAVGHRVTITPGQTRSYPSFTLRCPKGKVLKTFAHEGTVYPQIIGRSPFVRRRALGYRNKPTWGVIVTHNARETTVGRTADGAVYGLCR